ncbi:MAG: MTAP family purine nucleoside phosphorylase [Bdellovibrionales bacterium]|nr:MTAP family purine nucleoside phosphorylase [Bdellovibrionales bacterium]NQZ19377.1 MTAP family purine nucleoside phosphorylase [Bdellovibrionales bacterium]
MWSSIGGSGFEKFDNFKTVEELDRETPFGLCSEGFKKVELEGKEILFIPRHGTLHDLLPSEVNYRANIYALKKYGATKLVTFSAVGSLQNEYAPGDLVVPTQFIDRTKGVRKTSYCGEGIVGHVSLAEPVTPSFVSVLKEMSSGYDFKCHFDKTLVVMEGPQFSTKGESHLYRSWNADIIGMTSYPEYALAREAGLAYMNCCFVTDYDCWKDDIPHVTVEQVIAVMRKNNQKAYEVAKSMVFCGKDDVKSATEIEHGLKNALMSPKDALTKDQQNFMGVLTQ